MFLCNKKPPKAQIIGTSLFFNLNQTHPCSRYTWTAIHKLKKPPKTLFPGLIRLEIEVMYAIYTFSVLNTIERGKELWKRGACPFTVERAGVLIGIHSNALSCWRTALIFLHPWQTGKGRFVTAHLRSNLLRGCLVSRYPKPFSKERLWSIILLFRIKSWESCNIPFIDQNYVSYFLLTVI